MNDFKQLLIIIIFIIIIYYLIKYYSNRECSNVNKIKYKWIEDKVEDPFKFSVYKLTKQKNSIFNRPNIL